jgi:hypothetical protein
MLDPEERRDVEEIKRLDRLVQRAAELLRDENLIGESWIVARDQWLKDAGVIDAK